MPYISPKQLGTVAEAAVLIKQLEISVLSISLFIFGVPSTTDQLIE
jgi:hypothetical protein